MAGKRQHFMPQFLQQGFASRVRNDETYTWVFRKGALPFEANITKVGVESEFYNEDEDTEADDLITKDEAIKFAGLVRAIRDGEPSSLSDPRLPQLIAHLEIRTRHLRQNFIRMSDIAGSWLFNSMSSDGDTFADSLKRYCLEDPSWLRRSFSERPELPRELREYITEHYESLISETIDQLRPELPNRAAELKLILLDEMRQWIKSKHLEALKQPIALEQRVQYYKNLAYTILQTNEPLILGDSIVLFQVDGPRPYRPFFDGIDALNAVYLPLTPERVLIGARPSFVPVTTDLQKAIARCSLELFIAAENSEPNRSLQEIVGRDAEHCTREEMEAVIRKALESPSREWNVDMDCDTQSVLKSHKRDNPAALRGKKKIGRNAPCPCGSGRKYKKCCMAR